RPPASLPFPYTTLFRSHRGRLGRLIARGGLLATQPVEQGALPQLRAATDPDVRGGEFFGPAGFGETRGRVTEARLSREAADPERSEEHTSELQSRENLV